MHYKVEWDRDKANFYLSGSLIQYDTASRSVYFKNIFFSPGSRIVKWSSQLDYFQERAMLELPLLKRGEVYHISGQGLVHPADGVRIKVNCYDRTEKLLDTTLLDFKGGDFTYPSDAYFYTIELVNVGVEELLFDHLMLEQNSGGGGF